MGGIKIRMFACYFKKLMIILLFFSVFFSVSASFAAENDNTLYIASDGNDNNNGTSWDDAKKTIQNAINNINSEGTVYVENGTYFENIRIENKNIMLIGDGSSKTFLDGKSNSAVIWIIKGSSVSVDGFTIQNGRSLLGGGIHNAGDLTISNSIIQGNSAFGYGGGIYNDYGMITLKNSIIKDNIAISGGGGIMNYSDTIFIYDSIIWGNKAPQGSGIYNNGNIYADHINVYENSIYGNPILPLKLGAQILNPPTSQNNKINNNTINMQDTGAPATGLILVFLMVLVSLIGVRRK